MCSVFLYSHLSSLYIDAFSDRHRSKPHISCDSAFCHLPSWKSNALFEKWLMFNCRTAGKPLFCSSCRVSWVIVKGQGSSELHVSELITAIMTEFMTVPSSRSQGKHRSSLTTMVIMSFPINTPTINLCDCHILCVCTEFHSKEKTHLLS